MFSGSETIYNVSLYCPCSKVLYHIIGFVVLSMFNGSVRVAERLALLTSDQGVAGSNPAGGEILPEPKRRFIAQNLSCSPFHRLKMTEILLKGRKTITHPSIRLCLMVVNHNHITI